jgi:CBS domain-containing protein
MNHPAEGVSVAEVMHRGVLGCTPDTPLSDVARLMALNRMHCVIVRDEVEPANTALWGVVSDVDLVAAASVRRLDEQLAGATAATPLVTVRPEDTLRRAAQLMTEHANAHLVVVDAQTGGPLGVISTLDIARALSGVDV